MLNNTCLQYKLKTFINGFMTIVFSAVIVLFASSGNVYAEKVKTLNDLDKKSALAAYIFSEDQQNKLRKTGEHWDKKLNLQQDCKEKSEVVGITFMLIEPIDFLEGEMHPAAGAWQHRFAFKRCGEEKIYNTIFIAQNGERPKVIPFFPGTTAADNQLLRDAFTPAIMAAYIQYKNSDNEKVCQDIKIIDTRLTKLPYDVIEDGVTTKGVWNEEWIILVCDKPFTVRATFIPDGKGGTTFTFK